ncbi:MAG TPA: hypothetical protein VF746_25280 [Longimicrobium sp.]|jgi:hypothetical protein
MSAALAAPTLAPPLTPNSHAAALPGVRLLTVNEQPARRPLGAWAEDLSGSLATALAEPDVIGRARTVTGCGNNASLILAHAGRLDDAERVVRAQVAWLQAGADRTGEGALLALALQPWINLGRLHALRGHAAAALRHYAEVRACRMDAPVSLAGRAIIPAHWKAAGWEPAGLERFARTAWAIDGLRVLLAAGRWAEVREMADGDAERGAGGAAAFLREARWIALGREGRVDVALAQVEPAVRAGSVWDRMVAHVRRAELLLLAGDETSAAGTLGELVAVFGRMGGLEGLQLPALLIVQALAALAVLHVPSAAARTLAGRVAAGARRLDDEVMEIEILRLLAASDRPAERARRADELRRRTDATGYARLRPRDRPPAPSAAVDALLERILAALRTD